MSMTTVKSSASSSARLPHQVGDNHHRLQRLHVAGDTKTFLVNSFLTSRTLIVALLAVLFVAWYASNLKDDTDGYHSLLMTQAPPHNSAIMDGGENSDNSDNNDDTDEVIARDPNNWNIKDTSLPLRPIGGVIDDVEYFYMMPPPLGATAATSLHLNGTRTTSRFFDQIRGIFIFFHGCHHGGQDLFFLPEDRLVAKAALERQMVVLALTSQHRTSGCWSKSRDVGKLKHVFETWLANVVKVPASLRDTIPRIGMGASSGGSILFAAYRELRLSSMSSYVMWKSFTSDELQMHQEGKIQLPATAFVYMRRDEESMRAISKHVQDLIHAGVATKTWEVHPHPLTPLACSQRIPELGITTSASEGIVGQFAKRAPALTPAISSLAHNKCALILDSIQKHHGNLFDSNYQVLQPNGNGWDEILHDVARLDYFVQDIDILEAPGTLSPIQYSGHSWKWASLIEEVACAYGQHEMTAEYRNDVLDWLMINAGISFE